MNRIVKISAAALAALAMLVILPATMQAQNPDLSGTWAFNADKSQMGQAPGGGRTGGRGGGRMGGGGDMTITTEGNSISITRTFQGREGPMERVETYICDGEKHTQETGRGSSEYTAEWKDGVLHVSATMGFGDRTFTTTSTYTLKEEGKVLEVVSQMPGFQGGGTRTQTMVYDKK